MKIPMLDLKREYKYMKEDIDTAIARCLEHQHWIHGPEVQEFEEKLAEYLGVRHCIGTSSGTDALVLALRTLALKTKNQEYFDRSDLIITTPFTFTATGDAILRAGATPAFVDIDPVTYNIDPGEIRGFLTDYPTAGAQRYKAVGILPVHLYGQSCQMDEILSIADEYGLFVVEDVAQAFGGSWKGKKLGSIGTAGAFSFFPSKNLGGFGDAGAVSTNHDQIAELIRMLIKHGGKDKYNVEHIGYNARLDTLQAAILLAKLKYVDEFNVQRRRVAEFYRCELREAKGLVSPQKNSEHVFHQFTVRLSSDKRARFQDHLKENGVDSMIYYPVPLHKMKIFSGGNSLLSGDLMHSERISTEVISLPIRPLMNEQEILTTSAAVRND